MIFSLDPQPSAPATIPPWRAALMPYTLSSRSCAPGLTASVKLCRAAEGNALSLNDLSILDERHDPNPDFKALNATSISPGDERRRTLTPVMQSSLRNRPDESRLAAAFL